MIRIVIVLSMFVAGLLIPALSQATNAPLETSHLIVSVTQQAIFQVNNSND